MLGHLAALEAQMRLALAQIDAARHSLKTAPSTETVCVGVSEGQCAKRDPGARVALMGGIVICAGCQQRLTDPE